MIVGLTFNIDATLANRTNTDASLGTQQVNFINLNGSYHATFKAKCLVEGCSVNFSLGRAREYNLYWQHDGESRVQHHAGSGVDDL